MSLITDALIEIQNRGLDKIRCCLTGAPYATIDPAEIMLALQAEIEADSKISQDRLTDDWELKALTFNSQALPSLRGVKEKALMPMMTSGLTGQVKALTYMLTRLLFPHIGAEPLPSETAKERMLFAIHMYDTALNWEPMKTSAYVQQLVIIDSYCAMPYWHTLWAFESAFSKLGLAKSPKQVQETFADPLRVTEDATRIDAVIKYLYEVMLYVTERDGVAGRSGNKLAQQIMLIQAAVLPKIVIPHFQKQLSEADRLRLENKRKIDSRTELRVAHSAIHGKNTPIDYHNNAAWQMANALKKDLKKASESKPKAEPKQKPSNTKIDPRFAAAFNKLVLKQN
jgi:hypothetical protein